MKFRIVAVGKIKEEYLRQAVAEYVKRISRFAVAEVVEVEECLSRGPQTVGEIERVKNVEGEKILAKLEGFVIAADIEGKLVDSVQLSRIISQQKQYHSTFTFVIGGSNGLSDVVKSRADACVSFGRITMPHQLFRVVLAEQIYRACCIENNVAYHK